MFASDRSAGPLASLWPDCDGPELARRLTGLPVPAATDRAAWRADRFDAATLDQVRQAAQADLGDPWPQPLAHAWARFHRDGDREEYQQALFARQARWRRAVLMAALTEEATWLDQAVDGLVLACQQVSWCWPAHEEFAVAAGLALPNPAQPCLDLGAGEMAADLAWADAVLGPWLDQAWPGLRARLRHEVDHRVIEPFLAKRDWWWIDGRDGVNNWNPWIHANVIAAAIQLAGDDIRAQVVDTALAGIDRFADALPTDGAVAEGYSYWWEGVGRLLDLLVLLKHLANGQFDPFDAPAVKATVGFPTAMWLGPAGGDASWCVNFSDGRARTAGEPWHTLFAAATQTGDAAAAQHALRRREPGIDFEASLWRQLVALFDPGWRDGTDTTNAPELPQRVWLPSAQVMVARQEASGHGLTVAAKAGSNGEPHNHLDVGSFIVALDGVPFIVDAGRPTYTAQTFGPQRYELWMMQSQWHNTPDIDGLGQSAGPGFRAADVQFDEATTTLSFDLAGAYDLPAGLRGLTWRRRISLDRQTVVIDDSWNLPCPSAWHLLVAGTVTATADDVRVTTLDGKHIGLHPEPAVPVRVETKALDDPVLTGSWGDSLTRLTFDTSHLSQFRLAIHQKGGRHE